jgi:hypothetical protein
MRVDIDAGAVTLDEIRRLLEGYAKRGGLECRSMGAIAREEESGHWHLRRPDRRGTLEVSFLPRRGVVRIEVRANRTGDWTEETFRALDQSLRDATQGS